MADLHLSGVRSPLPRERPLPRRRQPQPVLQRWLPGAGHRPDQPWHRPGPRRTSPAIHATPTNVNIAIRTSPACCRNRARLAVVRSAQPRKRGRRPSRWPPGASTFRTSIAGGEARRRDTHGGVSTCGHVTVKPRGRSQRGGGRGRGGIRLDQGTGEARRAVAVGSRDVPAPIRSCVVVRDGCGQPVTKITTSPFMASDGGDDPPRMRPRRGSRDRRSPRDSI
jgi:hypothetical protein